MTSPSEESLPIPSRVMREDGTELLVSPYAQQAMLRSNVPDAAVNPRRLTLIYEGVRRETLQQLERHAAEWFSGSFTWQAPGDAVAVRWIYAEPPSPSLQTATNGNARLVIEEALDY